MAAVETLSVLHSVVDTLAVAIFLTAEVVSHRLDAQETDEGIELSDSVLQRGTGKAPAVDCGQGKC